MPLLERLLKLSLDGHNALTVEADTRDVGASSRR
jgi:hypothetical protein